MSHPTTRVLALLELLQAHHRLGGRELARRLGVDERTVRRYAVRLQDLGVPVVAERGRYGGYHLMPGYKLPPLMFTDGEAVAVVLGLLASERLGLATATPAVESALAKIQRVLPTALRAQTLGIQETLGFTLAPRQPSAPSTGVLLALGEAPSSAGGSGSGTGRGAATRPSAISTRTAWSSTPAAGTSRDTTTTAGRCARSGSTGSPAPNRSPRRSTNPPASTRWST